MHLKEQRYVTTIADEHSLSRAAVKLKITQPALSTFLSNLEQSLGVPLFVRTNRQMIPTEAGELYIETANQMLALSTGFYSRLDQLANTGNITLRLGVPRIQAPQLIPDLTMGFRQLYPNVELTFEKGLYLDLNDRLARDQLDAAFLYDMEGMDTRLFHSVPLLRDRLLLAVPHGELAALDSGRQQPGSFPVLPDLTLLQELPFILQTTRQTTRILAEEVFEQMSFTPCELLEEGSIETALRMAARGCGVTFLLESYLELLRAPETVDFFYLGNPPFAAEFALRMKKSRPVSAHLLQLAEYTRSLLTGKAVPEKK